MHSRARPGSAPGCGCGRFDDAVFCRYVRPTLNSIAMPLKELGEVAMDNLISMIRNNGSWNAVNT